MNNNIGNHAFEIVETAFNGNDIKNNLEDVLKLIINYTNANDIHIYKYNIYDNDLNIFVSLINKDKKITDFYQDGQVIDVASEIRIVLDNHCYIIIIDKNKETNYINEEYTEMLKRAFKIIFEKLELHEKLNINLQLDALTGVWNRRHYMEVTKELFKDGEARITYALIDLFRLKFINDHYGHDYGDKYIIKAAHLIKEVLNDEEMLFRFGGDEFVVISQNTSNEEMSDKLNMVNHKLNQETFNLKLPFPLLINYGIIEDIATLSDFNLRADELMSEHKTKTYQKLRIDRRR